MNQRHLPTKHATNNADKVNQSNTSGSGNNTQLEILGRPDQAGLVSKQQSEQGSEGQPYGLNNDAWKTHLEKSRDTAQCQAFKNSVKRRCFRCPFRLEDSDHGEDKSTDEPTDHPRLNRFGALVVKKIPGITGTDDDQRQQGYRLVHCPLQGHRLGTRNRLGEKAFFHHWVGRTHIASSQIPVIE